MSNAFRFFKLDCITVKPYYKLYLYILLFPIFFIFINRDPSFYFPFAMIMAAASIGYPFSFEEKNQLKNLYGTLSLKKEDIVKGRYLFILMQGFVFFAFACLASFVTIMVSKETFDLQVLFLVIGMTFALFSFIVSIQLPIYFKLDYQKGRIMTMIVYLVFLALLLSLRRFSSDAGSGRVFLFIAEHPYGFIGSLILFAVVAFLVSYLISKKLYQSRLE